ncbi:hypothetical protein BCR35DRAFT_195059 [Leucosporidium creatinivorum]|uniref:DUF6534 domain-containing protein n=1 Tax=Leucosporidium creatinivorum TaxID=106004 RepID=A0A1Y2DTX9_9BASI|nr:hypothetical protein BCR35DRAFT_195059 [Leucosporidium creatinivorum]
MRDSSRFLPHHDERGNMGAYDDTIGPFVLGAMLSTLLLGITTSQVWTYYRSFPHDKKLYLYIVGFLCALDWAHSAISVYTIYYWCVQNFDNPGVLVKSPWSFTIEPAMTGIASIISQAFYAYRVYVVSKRNPWMPIAIMIFSLIALGFSFGSTGEIFCLNSDFSRFGVFKYGVSLWLASAAFADVLITASLVYYLKQSQSHFVTTNNIIDTLVENVVSTNGVTAVVAIVDTILFAASSTSWHVLPQLCLIKLYFNSLLVSLNARTELERQLNGGSYGHHSAAGLNGRLKQSGSEEPKLGLVTPLGFGANDVRIHSTKAAAAMRMQKASAFGGIQVQTERNVDTFVELGTLNKSQQRVARSEEDEVKVDLDSRTHTAPWE